MNDVVYLYIIEFSIISMYGNSIPTYRYFCLCAGFISSIIILCPALF